MAATLAVLQAADAAHGLGLEVETMEIGLAALANQGTTLPDAVLDRVPQVDGVILGPVSHYDYPRVRPAGSTPRASCARVSGWVPISARPGAVPAWVCSAAGWTW